MNITSKKFDVCIVGAGIAGATMAAKLAKSGKEIVIVERNLGERDVIIGELLQPGGVQRLFEMGFEFFLDNIDAQPVYGYDIVFEGRDCHIPYPNQKGEPTGFGFRNGAFLQNIRKYILAQPNVTVIEGRVTELLEENSTITGVRFLRKHTTEEETLNADLTIVTDGPMSRFREQLSNPLKKVNGHFLGLLLKNCELPYPNHGHLFMGGHPPFVIYPVTSGTWRILVDFKGEQSPKFGPDFKKFLLETFEKMIPSSARDAFVFAVEEANFKMFPNHRLPAMPLKKAGAVLLGDALNMRHPLTGGGMTAVFADVKNLGENLAAVTDFSDTKMLGKAVQKYYDTRHLGTQTTNILADGLYGVVYNPNLRRAFFEYVSRGGKYAAETIAILAGLNRDKKLLLTHFLGLARYGSQQKLKTAVVNPVKKGDGAFKMVKTAAKSGETVAGTLNMVKDALLIITPLLLTEKPDAATKLMLKTLSRKLE
ncbi:MAG: FAD-dependent monooxygenase [Bacteroidales bacterium]|nr:FAD-dependent monooxygenase [Bacteroidales bacterium]